MSDPRGPEEPFDPYAPPPPGQPPGQPPPYGGAPGPGYGPPQGQPYPGQPYPGQQPGRFPASYPGQAYGYPQQKESTQPLWLGALAALLLITGLFSIAFVEPQLASWLSLAVVVGTIVLLIVPATRRWGLGLVIGGLVSIPIGLIVLAGVCIYLIAALSGGQQ